MPDRPDSFFDRAFSSGWFAWMRLEVFIVILMSVFMASAAALDTEVMMRWANSLMLGMGVAVLFSYLPGTWRRGVPYASRLVIWGVCLTWASALERRIIDTLYWKTIAPPIYGVGEDLVLTFLAQQVLFTATLGGLMHVCAPGALDGKVPDRNWALVGMAVGVSVAVWTFSSYW